MRSPFLKIAWKHFVFVVIKIKNDKLWDEAMTAAKGLKDGDCGLTDGSVAGDWRLPNVREFLSLIDYKFYGLKLPLTLCKAAPILHLL